MSQTPFSIDLGPLGSVERDALDRATRLLDDAERRGNPAEISHALAQIARRYRDLGALPAAEGYFAQALGWSRTLGGVDASVDLLCDLAEIAESIASNIADADDRRGHAARERARDHGFEAAQLARQCADPCWEITVLMRISDVLDRCGDRDDAIELHRRALHLITQRHLSDFAPTGH